MYHDKGRFSEANDFYQEAIEISLQVSGNQSLNYVLQINNLAYLYEDMERYDLAEALYRESVLLRKSYHAENPYRVASSMGNLARLLAKKGQYVESQIILDEIILIYTAQKEPNTQNYITAVANLLQDNPSDDVCQTANQEIALIVPEVNKMSAQSWRRMYSELWLGELLLKCSEIEWAKKLLLTAKERSRNIYVENSDGQLLIQSKVDQLLSGFND